MRANRKRPSLASRLLIAAALPVLPLLTNDAAAFEVFGYRFFEAPVDPDISPDAQRYTIAINTVGADNDLHAAVLAASALWADRDGTPPPSCRAPRPSMAASPPRSIAKGAMAAASTSRWTDAIPKRSPPTKRCRSR